ncbi:hypothetical protein [Pseudomonas sp. KU43P]|uniref:hypothetical protein n=1 Tax=Pseudomonas sp. KU43P TaxID=2487887 RepID=UPI0012A7E635|nr:hypothetical protein [Pseudomonas sp. KU43P]BBH44361.1 hypothetical protein KU43P_08380 [Pseudomonas sp. KU43P]
MEFYDVKTKDFIELAGIPDHLQGTVIAEHRVKWRLREILEDRNVQEPFDQIFFTTWSDDGVVNYSKSLVELLTEAVVDSEPPSVRAHGGLFGARGVTSEDLHINIEMQIIDEALMVVYKHIKQIELDD